MNVIATLVKMEERVITFVIITSVNVLWDMTESTVNTVSLFRKKKSTFLHLYENVALALPKKKNTELICVA